MFLGEYFKTAYFTCIHYLVNNKIHWTEKLYWIICIPVCMICAYLVIFITIMDYHAQTVSYTVDTSYLEWETFFPSVLICETENDMKLNQMQSEWFGKDDYINDKIDSIRLLAFYRGSLDNLMNFISNSYKVVTSNFSFYTNAVRSKCPEMFSSCLYNGEPFECCDGFIPVETLYGQCFTINNKLARAKAKKRYFSIKRGPNQGVGNLSVELRKFGVVMGVFSTSEVLSPKNLKQLLLETIHENDEVNVFLNVIEVVTSNEATILSVVKRQCRYPYENNLKHFSYYTQSNCEIECLIDAQLKYCNCFEHVLPTANSTTECTLKGLECTYKRGAEIEKFLKHCECINSCDELEIYHVGTISYDKNSHYQFREKLTKCRINIIVPAPSLRYYRRVVKGPLDLLVSVCGALNLFLGCSIMSMVEFFFYILVRPISDLIRRLRAQQEKNIAEAKPDDNKILQNPSTIIYQPQYYYTLWVQKEAKKNDKHI